MRPTAAADGWYRAGRMSGRRGGSKSLNDEPCEIRFNGVVFCFFIISFYVTVGRLQPR